MILAHGGSKALSASNPLPQSRNPDRSIVGLGLAAVAAVLALVIIFALLSRPGGPPPPGSGIPVEFVVVPKISGNESSGWTFSIGVTVTSRWERWGPVAWGDLNFELMNSTSTGLTEYDIPAGTTLRAFSDSPSPVAEYNLSLAVWEHGASVLVETGQMLVLHGLIPPGTNFVHGTTGTVVGPTLVVRYANDGQPLTIEMTFADKWVYD